jgi:hypothetical protein
VANIVQERAFGPGGQETKRGTKHFRPGAKVYVIDWFPGMCENIVVIGQHRRSRSYIKVVTRADWIENLRVKLAYSPKVIEIAKEHARQKGIVFSEEHARSMCNSIPHWQDL